MDEETKALSDEKKLELSLKVANILRDETGYNDEMVFILKTAAGLVWGSGYSHFFKV